MEKSQNPDRADAVKSAAETAVTANGATANGVSEPPPPLTPAAWLAQNGIYLVLIGFLVGLALYYGGLNSLWRWCLVGLGLGFVIFIHELGHFLTAKWCDVHVQTFSLGFGPALPGCSFKYGETLYKIALFPLGGYVGMVGEGADADEDENYPRSFKNKTVGQRMLIISAGVIMNILFGCVAFVLVFRLHGVQRVTANIGHTEAGSPLWKIGARSGSTFTQFDDVTDPDFDTLRRYVGLSSWDEQFEIKAKQRAPEGRDLPESADLPKVKIKPRSDKNDPMPMIGVAPAAQLTLLPERFKKDRAMPVFYHSAAAYARAIPEEVTKGTVVVEASDPEDPETTTKVKGWGEVCDRLRQLGGKPLLLRVRPADAPSAAPTEVKVHAAGFDWDDSIVGTTDPKQDLDPARYDPFDVTELPPDVSNHQKKACDYFEYRRRLKMLAGRPMVVQVRRKADNGDGPLANLLVPPEYHRSFGMRMRMGEVAAVRDGSPAAGAGLQSGDVITRVVMTTNLPDVGVGLPAALPLADLHDFDALRLPFELRRAAASAPGLKAVVVTVDRPNPPGAPVESGGDDAHKPSKEKRLGPMIWDDSWDFNEEFPGTNSAALSVAQLGLAYRVDSTVVAVESGSPAEKAGLQPTDEIVSIAFRKPSKNKAEVDWSQFEDLKATRGDKQERYDRWAFVDHVLQSADYPEIQMKVKRNGEDKSIQLPETKDGGMAAEPDRTWPEFDRGIELMLDTRLQKADSMWEALKFGVGSTVEFIQMVYQSMRSVSTGRVSPSQFQGPVKIAGTAFAAADDPWELLRFLAIISVNLAVVNFLPIPVLDGGHMVFLIYEKLRGKPASDAVRQWATVAGLVLILGLMAFLLWREAVLPLIKMKWR